MSVDKFVEAFGDGNVDELTTLLDSTSIDINAFDHEDWTALMKASHWGHEAAVRLLLTRGANVNMADKDGMTALMWACAEGHLPIAELLLRSGADHSLRTKDGWTALMDACADGHLPIAELLLRSGADLSLQTRDGMTALMWACAEGHLPTAELLLRSGADHSLRTKDGNTALHLACYYDKVDVAELLLGRGASCTCRNNAGQTPIERCDNSEKRAKIQGFIDALAAPDASMSASSSTPVPAVPAETATDWDAVALEHAVQKAIGMKEKCWNRSKIMLVGQGRAGKSSLARVILGHDFNAESPSTCGMDKFEVSVSTGMVQNAQDSSQCQWREYKETGSHLNNALASMAQNMAKLDDERQVKAELDNVNQARDVQVNSSNSAADDAECAQNQVASLPSTSDSIPTSSDAESSPQIPSESVSESKAGTSITESVPQQVLMPELPFDISLIAKTQAVKDSDLLLSVFDFGGQEIFNCVHPFFLTENGAYLVVFNMVECLDPTTQLECLRFLMFWVNSIAMHTKREITINKTKSDKATPDVTMSDIYIVGTHRDQLADKDLLFKIDELLMRTLSASVAWPFVIKEETHMFFPVDCTLGLQDAVAGSLMQNVESRLKKSPFVTNKRPLTWFSVLDELESAGKTKSMISLGDLEAIAAKYLIGKDELFSLLRFLREMGVLLWYEEAALKDAVILDPVAQFITPVTRIICDPLLHSKDVHTACNRKFSNVIYETFRSSGIVDVGLLEYILSFKGENATLLIQMMQMYGLLVHWQPIQLKRDDLERETKYLVPSLFSESAMVETTNSMAAGVLGTEIIIPPQTGSKGTRTFILVFSLDPRLFRKSLTLTDLQQQCFLPTGFFEQLMCKALVWCQYTPHALLSNCSMHKLMVELSFGNVKFRMILRSRHNCIQVDVPGHGQEAHSVLARLTLLVKEIISKTGCALHMESFVPSRADNDELFVCTKSVPVGAMTRPGSANIGWISCQSQHDRVFDVFLSYRWNKLDSDLVASIFDHLQDYCFAGKKTSVFYDHKQLQEGDPIRSDIFNSLLQTTVFAPIVSSRALERMISTEYDATLIDNLLFEWISAILLFKLRPTMADKIAIEKIMPTLLPQMPDVTEKVGTSAVETLKKRSILTEMVPHVVKLHPSGTIAAVLACFNENAIDLPPFLKDYADTVTVNQIVTDLLMGSMHSRDDDIIDKFLPCRVAARAVNAVQKTESFARRMNANTREMEEYTKKMDELARAKQVEEAARESVCIMEPDPWCQLDVMSLLTGRLEKYRDGFVQNQVTVELLRECNLDDAEGLPKDLGVPMSLVETKMFITALKKALTRK